MAQLMYKTRGNSSPQGKPRVYFCCHPKDFEKFFEFISEEILSLQNCAIWYKSGTDGTTEELLADLKQMQLFVMPVTTNLLCTDNETLSVEFKYAIEQHIPVLPLMQESGLNEIFNHKCGDLQFLDKYHTDSTEIAYEEKLKKYLDSVLIGDELAEKIRAAFDAYVFLSYRKKDRKYAQELMRLIHKNDFCRDIALWYDEFLTPGENFNDAIRDALQKSKLFVLTVTPNLVNEVNYIMTTEYPMARDQGKPILPAELVPTDSEKLSRMYTDIPACTDAHDDAQLSSSLLDALQSIAIREHNTPEHNFFIGLAYLGGVDVEVDYDRALALIQSSAEQGLPEAMEKLVAMYRTGEGVGKDYITAIMWQTRLVEYYRTCHNTNASNRNTVLLVYAQLALGDYCSEQLQFSEAQAAYANAHMLCEKMYRKFAFELMSPKENPSPTRSDINDKIRAFIISIDKKYCFRRILAISYERLGNMAKAETKLSKAKDYYEQSLKIRKAIVEDDSTAQALRDLALSYDDLGDIAKEEGKLPEAKDYYEQSLKIREKVVYEMEKRKEFSDLSLSHKNLGDVAKLEGNIDKARACYEQSLRFRSAVSEETRTVLDRRALVVIYERLGNIALTEKKTYEAKMCYQQAWIIAKEINEEAKTVQARRDLATLHTRIGYIAKVEMQLLEARAHYSKCLALREALAKETGSPDSYDDYAAALYNMTRVCTQKSEWIEYVQKAYDIWNELVQKYPYRVSFSQRREVAKKALNLALM